ncbi:MAG: PepSY domain-containing protein [Hyphomonadaceae bacterium]|nr:PepSY domain-containing protein [Hyphomonadaceae bacterium]MBY0421906.1 PepSY domain-containing protein [Parvularculaceae bacterium]
MSTTHETASSGLYRFIWRWHFYAGLIVAPFLILLALTGGLYLFEREIDGLLHRKVVHVQARGEPSPVSQQETAVRAAYPGATIGRVALPTAADRASEFGVTTSDGRALAVFVDPATASVTGAVPDSARLTSILSALHGELMIGRVGDLIVELAASWGFILLTTGLFLWWPRSGRKAGVVTPRLDAKGRAFWRDLHAVPAMWTAPVIAFLILTGLPWSGFWGDNLARLGTVQALAPIMAPTPNFSAAPNAPPHHAPSSTALDDLPHADELPWAVRHAGLPIALVQTGHDHSEHVLPPAALTVDAVVAMAEERGMKEAGLRIFYPRGESGVFTASFVPDRAEDQRTLHVDPRDGTILADIGWAQYSPLGKIVEFGVMTHLGRQFGLTNQLILAAVCASFVAIIGAGLWMWWRRRPKGRIGTPPGPHGFRLGTVAIAIAVLLGILFPLAGVSMLLTAAADWLWTKTRRDGAMAG